METKEIEPVLKKNWVKRSLTAIALITLFITVIYIGLPILLFTCLLVQIKCFEEVINIAYNSKKIPEIPLFRTLNWYFVILANYFFYGETFARYLQAYVQKYPLFGSLFTYHRFLSFCWYIIGLIWFVNLLRRKVIREQFSLLAWTHFLCIIIVFQSYMIVQNLFEGLIWGILPVCLVFVNDIFAYIFGRIYGKTPLIKVSPKKTLEGFFGGAIGTLVLGTILAYAFCFSNYLVCPTKYVTSGETIKMTTDCTPSYLFQPYYFDVGLFTIPLHPFLLHAQIFSLFASLIAPFGGFCASGFKRAFKIKDFGDTIPGHGGVMDRFDCQYLMASFVNAYIYSFVKNVSVEKIFDKVMYLSDESQVKFYHLLGNSLKSHGILERY